ncbi:MAG: PAS domain-containing protein [Alphaproteobacteria bacterium]
MPKGSAVLANIRMGPGLPGNVPDDCHEKIRQIVEYWVSIHPPAGLPGRQHFDPMQIPSLLPYIRLLNVVGSLPRFRVRLLGTQVREYMGEEQTGRWLDEVFPNLHGSVTHAELVKAVAMKMPRWRKGKPAIALDRIFLEMERVYLPFARDGRKVDMLLTFHLVTDGEGALPSRPSPAPDPDRR